jgi:hypothetical protein
LQLNFLSCSFLSTDTLSTLFCSCGPSVLRSLSSLIYLIPHSFEAPLTRSRLLWCVSSKRARSHPVHYQQLEGRHAFLDSNTSSRLPHWLPLSSLGPRSTIRFADPRFCRFSTCPPSRRQPPISKTSCRRSATIYHARPQARPWLHTLNNGMAAMPRSSCLRWRR